LNWKKDMLIFTSGLLTALTATALDDPPPPLAAEQVNKLSRHEINWFDRGATYNWSETAITASDITIGLLIASPLALAIDKNIRSDFGTVGLMYLETMLFAASLPSIGKGSVERIRPYIYNPEAPLEKKLDSDAKRSFFSGHTTMAFATSVFLAKVYTDYYPNSKTKYFIWAGSMAAASFVGYLRYEAGVHYPSDIMVGGSYWECSRLPNPIAAHKTISKHQHSTNIKRKSYNDIIYDTVSFAFGGLVLGSRKLNSFPCTTLTDKNLRRVN